MSTNLEHFSNLSSAQSFLTKFGICKTRDEATKYLRSRIPSESVYQTNIMKHLKKICPGAFIWKAAAGPYSRRGIPDVNMVYAGKFYGFEVKRPYFGKISKLQEDVIEKINKAGGRAAVVTFPEEAETLVQLSERDWRDFIERG